MYLLMDSADPSVQELLEFRCVRPLQTVAKVLEEKGAAGLLQDPLLPLATQEIVAGEPPPPPPPPPARTPQRTGSSESRAAAAVRG